MRLTLFIVLIGFILTSCKEVFYLRKALKIEYFSEIDDNSDCILVDGTSYLINFNFNISKPVIVKINMESFKVEFNQDKNSAVYPGAWLDLELDLNSETEAKVFVNGKLKYSFIINPDYHVYLIQKHKGKKFVEAQNYFIPYE